MIVWHGQNIYWYWLVAHLLVYLNHDLYSFYLLLCEKALAAWYTWESIENRESFLTLGGSNPDQLFPTVWHSSIVSPVFQLVLSRTCHISEPYLSYTKGKAGKGWARGKLTMVVFCSKDIHALILVVCTHHGGRNEFKYPEAKDIRTCLCYPGFEPCPEASQTVKNKYLFGTIFYYYNSKLDDLASQSHTPQHGIASFKRNAVR
jgi:hypothetical protein